MTHAIHNCWHSYFGPCVFRTHGGPRRPAPTGSGFRHNFSNNYPNNLKIVKKDAPRDFYNLRLKSDAKIKYYQNYSNSATQITLVTTTYYSCNLVLN